MGIQSKEMETSNDIQYALKGMLTEISHLATDEYFDPSYIAQKARIIFEAIREKWIPFEKFYRDIG